MSEPETCLGCGRKVADDAAWKRSHDDDRCGDGCWCAAYCWLDASCVPKPPDLHVIARADVPALLAEVRRLREERDAALAEVARLSDALDAAGRLVKRKADRAAGKEEV